MDERDLSFQAIGTLWQIRADSKLSDGQWQDLSQKVRQRIDVFDKSYSRFRRDSLVARMSRKAGRYDLPPDGFKLLKFYEKLYRATDGKLTPLIGQAVSDAGYDAAYSFKPKELKHTQDWDKVISYTPSTIYLKQPALLDFGAAGKGYLVDIIGSLLEQAGLDSFVINAGGDILHRSRSNEPLKIGLENPADTSEVIGIAKILNLSFCASAGSKRRWGEFHHIIDPHLKASPNEILATWVIADSTMVADGLATALFFTDAASLQKHFNFSYGLLNQSMAFESDKDFPVKVFKA